MLRPMPAAAALTSAQDVKAFEQIRANLTSPPDDKQIAGETGKHGRRWESSTFWAMHSIL
jgi:hypothetical protein